MLHRGYAGGGGGQNPANNRNDSADNNQISFNQIGSNQNLNQIQSAVATLLGDNDTRRETQQREMLINLVRQEQMGIDDTFESDNQWLSRSEQSSPSSASPSAARMRANSREEEQTVLTRTSYFAEPTPIIQELRELRARNQDIGSQSSLLNAANIRRNEPDPTTHQFNPSQRAALYYGNQTSQQQEVRQQLISSPLNLHSGEVEMTLGINDPTERSVFDTASPTRSTTEQMLQSASGQNLPLLQAITSTEEQKIENILQQIEESKQPPQQRMGYNIMRRYNERADSADDYDIPSLPMSSARSNNSLSSIQTIQTTGLGGNGASGSLAASGTKLDEFFSCFICFGTIQNAVMCPHCSKLGCANCLRKWVEETRPQCPHCRASLHANQLVPCRFFQDVMSIMQQQDQQAMNRKKELCPQHNTTLNYYCKTCKVPICSDCGLFGDAHKSHQFEKLKEVYQRHVDLIRGEASGLSRRLRDFKNNISEVQGSIEKVQKAKQDRVKELETFVENIQAQLTSQTENKLATLESIKTSKHSEVMKLEDFYRKLNSQLNHEAKSKLIKKSAELVRQIRELNQSPINRFSPNQIQSDFPSDIVPEYASCEFKLSNFSQLRHSEEPIYSPAFLANGITWRLKVYPNGNGQNAQGTYISIFLEMYKAPQSAQPMKPQMYEYRVELINHLRPSQMVFRVYQSEFEVGECWGYNRFYRIDQLESEGYLSNDSEDCILLKYYVRPPNYHILAMDQLAYIQDLEKKSKDQEADLMQARRQITELQKKQQKKSKKSTKKCDTSDSRGTKRRLKEEVVPQKLKIKNMFGKQPVDEAEMPRSSGSVGSKEAMEESKTIKNKTDVSQSDRKMHAGLKSYLSVSESDAEEDKKKSFKQKKPNCKGRKMKDSSEDDEDRQIAATIYSGLISHSESSNEEDKEARSLPGHRHHVDGLVTPGDKGDDVQACNNPDFMVSDEPPEEFQSQQKRPEDSFGLYMKIQKSRNSSDEVSKSLEDEEAQSILGRKCNVMRAPDSARDESEDRSAYSSLDGVKKPSLGVDGDQKNRETVFEYENLSSFSEDAEEEKKEKAPAEKTKIESPEQFPESDKDEEEDEDEDAEEGSEGIDEGFLQVTSAGSLCTNSQQDDTRNSMTHASNQDEPAMVSVAMASDIDASGMEGKKIRFIRQSVTQDDQQKTMMKIKREFQDRSQKMRGDLLSMRQAILKKQNSQSARDSSKSDEK